MTTTDSRTVGILVFDEVEVLDFCGPFEVFSVARPAGEYTDEHKLFTAVIIAEEERTVRCRGGLLVQPHFTLTNHPALDILVVPGGFGTRKEMHNQRLLSWIKGQQQSLQLVTSVCTGAFLLAESHVLDQQRATTHWASIDSLRSYPAITVIDNARVVDEGKVVTSAGVSAGIDMSLHVVSQLHGQETAEWTARFMEYDWSTRGQVLIAQ